MSCFRGELHAKFVIRRRALTFNSLTKFPFVRFDKVTLCYSGRLSIANKCEIFASRLQKTRLKEANSICVWATIDQMIRHHDFCDHTQLLEHLRNQILPICGYRHRYEFNIDLESDKFAVANIITSILEMQQVNECSNVGIRLVIPNQYEQLPIGTISNWLHRNRNTDNGENKFANQNQRERVLEIEVANISNSNVVEMWNHLRKVFFGIFKTFKAEKSCGTR